MFKIPKEVSRVTEALEKAGFEAYLVGGCVRDLLRGVKPKDWDVTTNAKPEEIEELFRKTVYENEFGTVAVKTESEDPRLKIVEVTPYRLEAKYSDHRHPDSVVFSEKLEDDLKRRDFTINAIAYKPKGFTPAKAPADKHKGHDKGQLVDLFGGVKDIEDRVIRAVGNPEDRFAEDALRILRAIRLATELSAGWRIEKDTEKAIRNQAHLLKEISKERIRDEFVKIIMSEEPMKGIELAQKLEVLKYFIPELEEGIDIKQNKEHAFGVWAHNLRSLQNAANKGWPLEVRLAAMLHDIAKPRTRRFEKEKQDYTFYGHEIVGARMTRVIMRRLRFSNEVTDTVVKLVRNHMFFSDIERITLSAVRRIIRNVGHENVWDLMKVRKCDRIGMGRPKETPYRLRKYESMVEEAMRDPVSVKQLKINGDRIMELIAEKPGPRIGWILHALLEDVLDDPKLNTEKYLEKKALELGKLPDRKLAELGQAGREAKEIAEAEELAAIRKRHYVK